MEPVTVEWGKRFGTREAYYVSKDGRWLLRQAIYQYKPNNTVRARTIVEWEVVDRFEPIPVEPTTPRPPVAKASTKKLCLERFYAKLAKGMVPPREKPEGVSV